MSVKERVKSIRKKLHLTLKEFAFNINVPLTTISKYEKGSVKPSFDVLANIGKVYNVNLNWLLNGKGEMFLGGGKVIASEGSEPSVLYSKDKDKRIRELEQELSEVKKSIQELDKENKMLNRELIAKMQKLLNLQDKLIPV